MIDLLAAGLIWLGGPDYTCPPTALGCPTQHISGYDCQYDGPRICPPGNTQSAIPGWYGNDNCWPGAVYCPPADSPPDLTVRDGSYTPAPADVPGINDLVCSQLRARLHARTARRNAAPWRPAME